jgi:DNA-binding NarL/FixJ family response regulator
MTAGEGNVSQGHTWRVLIVDDHAVVRQGLRQLLGSERDLEVCGEAETAHEALGRIEALKPDVVVLDLSLRESDGLDLLKDIRVRFPAVKALVLSMHDEGFYGERVLRAGGRGYVMKEEAAAKVLEAVRCVLRGEIYLSQHLTSRMLSSLTGGKSLTDVSTVHTLSDRELQVFRLIGQGLGTRQIAEKLNLSIKTIESHRENVKRKLGLADATELVRHAVRWVEYGQP